MGGLVVARALENARTSEELSAAVAAFASAWHAEIAGHFDDEERLLLPLLTGNPLGGRLVAEHTTLRAHAARCLNHPSAVANEPGTPATIGRLLREHIRWEERDLFESIQREHPGALQELMGESSLIEQARPASQARLRLDWNPHAATRRTMDS